MIRMNNFLYVFTLRQGAILIALHQIALCSFLLIVLLVGISHVGTMLSMLYNDMEDDADRSGYNTIGYGEQDDQTLYGAGTTNQRRFAKAQHLASATVIFLYSSTILMAVYLMCCISLLHGAVKYKSKFVYPWIIVACICLVCVIILLTAGDVQACLVSLFGGHHFYHFGCAVIVFSYVYAIYGVTCFALELGRGRLPSGASSATRAELLLLLDHSAHSSLLSAAQLNKLNSGTRSQFV